MNDIEQLNKLTEKNLKAPQEAVRLGGGLLEGLVLWQVAEWFLTRPGGTGFKTKIKRDGKAWAVE